MTSTALVAWGDGVAIVLDRSVREQLGLAPGAVVELSCENGVLTVKPCPEAIPGRKMSFEEAHNDISSRYDAMLKRLS